MSRPLSRVRDIRSSCKTLFLLEALIDVNIASGDKISETIIEFKPQTLNLIWIPNTKLINVKLLFNVKIIKLLKFLIKFFTYIMMFSNFPFMPSKDFLQS